VVQQKIVSPGGEIACEAEFVMGLFDVRQRKLVDPTDEWLACLGWPRPE
jgi:acyl-CoA thioester hydrolase